MRSENRCLFGNAGLPREAEDLKAATIGEDRSGPTHKRMEPSERFNNLTSGTQREMVRIAEHHFAARLADRINAHTLYRPERTNRHEGRHLNFTVRCAE